MALFHQCWQQRRSTLDRLQWLLEDAQTNQARERTAAIHIQRLFRGQRVRATITTQRNAEIVLARVYRGHLARRRCRRLREQEQLWQQHAVFHYYAIIIQKVLRGVHSRRTKLDFRVRKAYIREIAAKGDAMRQQLEENLRRQQQEERQANDEAARHELAQVSQNLHHLVSTRAIAGVYNSPMLASTATAFGIPVETHIRENTKTLISTQLTTATAPTKLIPYPPSNKASLQAAAPYDAPLRAVRTQKKYHKLRRISAQDFQAVHNSNQDTLKKLAAPGINAGVEYLDDWKNPYKKRGIPRAKEDLLPQLTTLGKPPKEKEKPFYLTSGGNKSKVYANDRFDV
ncbi:hypothetical protein Poli38472_001231 [Pythium oligandrum]|uniref:Uncharacterized protein n=1 Tax=Pythium oligandrum TaxID=41045 RepID=A0A8K1FM83_PYTOL|nr:hypothetical protein Poli38472_001231 [Pythium oligandrum]|eukprot:TMW69075.1 hypothetical protein Poli38472_001231 [Pythium oligandrum]